MSEQDYNSAFDTLRHIQAVAELIYQISKNLDDRALGHDESKLEQPEKGMYDEFTPRLKNLEYGSEEYKACLAEMKPALAHHYRANRHHPEHYPNGIVGMSLLDILEMLADWTASVRRTKDGNIMRSLQINKERFQIPDALFQVMVNTLHELGWTDIQSAKE